MTEQTSVTYPVLPLRDIVVFPHMIVPLFVGRDKSVRALEAVMAEDQNILLTSQKDASDNDPAEDAIYRVGVMASVLQLLTLPDGTVKVLVEGKKRVRITEFVPNEEYFEAQAEPIAETQQDADAIEALMRSVSSEFARYAKMNNNVPEEAQAAAADVTDPAKLADTVAGHLSVKLEKKQELLEIEDVGERLEKIYALMQGEMSVLKVEKKIKSRVKNQMERTQREYYLNEQMKAIQRELGEGGEGPDESAEYDQKIEETKFTKEAKEKAEAELKKLKSMSPMGPDAWHAIHFL